MPNGGLLKIACYKQLDSCIIQVNDNGIGIEPKVLSQVFDPFFTMKKEGTGLGLTVCKQIIDACGGKISIQSKVHQGTEITIKLPRHLESFHSPS